MSEDEVCELIDRVRIYYQHMSRSDDVNDEWYRILKNYSVDEVNKNLDSYLRIERNRNRIPMPQDLVQGLLTIKQKQSRKKQNLGYIVRCNLCQREMSLEHYDEHYGKCLSIMHLKRILKRQGKDVEYGLLENLDENKFNAIYEKYKKYDEEKSKKFLEISKREA